jgi:hypothetical protein
MDANASANDLGPATEARLAEAFADRILLTAQDTAKLLGIDPRSLREMHLDGTIRAVIVGRSTYRFAEIDIRAYISSGGRPKALRQTAPDHFIGIRKRLEQARAEKSRQRAERVERAATTRLSKSGR